MSGFWITLLSIIVLPLLLPVVVILEAWCKHWDDINKACETLLTCMPDDSDDYLCKEELAARSELPDKLFNAALVKLTRKGLIERNDYSAEVRCWRKARPAEVSEI